MNGTPNRELDYLEKAGLLLLVFQLGVFIKMWSELGLDRATDTYPILVMSTVLIVASQRKLLRAPPNRGAAQWIVAARAMALALPALGTLAVAVKRLAPDLSPAPELIAQTMIVLMWAVVALKGAGIGKLKPGSAMGLCVRWTKQSRLAWDKAHRALGRVLFWGGLVGLFATFVLPLLASALMWFGTVTVAVTLALVESWRTWRLDPNRGSSV